MDINFVGKYKSLTSFEWKNIPDFVVITGPNGSGKSQLLNLIYNTVISKAGTTERVSLSITLDPKEITFLKEEWQLQNTSHVTLASLQNELNGKFQGFKQNHHMYARTYEFNEHNVKLNTTYQSIFSKLNKGIDQVTIDEFTEHYPEILIEQESQISQKISEIFYNYRLLEIEQLSKGKSKSEIVEIIGAQPWVVLREIIKASKLPFDINDPSENGFKDSFQLKLTHQILGEAVEFNDLSSGERVLLSLAFYLYNSQEKNFFPKLLLMDEPDAHLHPSMSQQFLNVVKNVLVDKYGVRVIMTTHSPSTVILAPTESLFEMSRTEPRIKKCISKNHAVSLLTAGLVYVGEGTKYFLVEDNDDVSFYSYVYSQLVSENILDASIPLVFMPASTKDKSGGKDAVQNWVNKLHDSGLIGVVRGLIDSDSGNSASDGIFMINRYSIENYLTDPLLVFAVLLDKEKAPQITGINFSLGDEYKLKNASTNILQLIADKIISLVEPSLSDVFPDFNSAKDLERVPVEYLNGRILSYPRWLLERRGKTILNQLYNSVFTSPVINFSALIKALKKINMFPIDLVSKLSELRE